MINPFTAYAKIQEMSVQISNSLKNHESLTAQNQILVGQISKLQKNHESLTAQNQILVGQIQEFHHQQELFRGNQYTHYTAAVTEIDRKYKGIADWGVAMTQNLINVMAAFTLGHGVGFSGEDAGPELAFLKELFDYNDFNDEGLIKIVVEAYIEGKLLTEIAPDNKHKWVGDSGEQKQGIIKIRFKPWRQLKYIVETAPSDYLDCTKCSWEGNGDRIKAGSLTPARFIYRKFGGNLYEPNEACPKIMSCLTEIDDYDKCKRDWREINHLFASPTPDFQLADMTEVIAFQAWLEKVNWRIGKAISHIGQFRMVSASMEGVNSLEREKLSLQKTISGATGVPVHFYDPEVMSNKRLGENEMEFVWASFNLERQTIKSAIDELVLKAMAMQTAETNEALDYRKVKSTIKIFTDGDWQRLKDIFMPMRKEKMISENTLLARIPGVDVEEEKQLLEEERDVESQKVEDEATKALEDLKNGAYKAPFGNPANMDQAMDENKQNNFGGNKNV